MKYLAYVELFKRTSALFQDAVQFPAKGNINEPILKDLWEAKGCITTTVEVMMKFYKALSTKKQGYNK